MKNIAILASGEGTNAERIIRYFEEKEEVNVAVVIASRASAGVIKRVEHLHVPCRVVTSAGFASGEALQVLQEYKTDFVVLAGFLLRIPDAILHAYPKRMVNIHPSLLPKFGGKGMYGIHVHEAVLKAGEEAALPFNILMKSMTKGITSSKPDAWYCLMIRPKLWLNVCISWSINIIRRL